MLTYIGDSFQYPDLRRRVDTFYPHSITCLKRNKMRETIETTITENLKTGTAIQILALSEGQEALLDDHLLPFFRKLTEMDRSVRLQKDLRGMPHEVQEEYFHQHLWYAVRPWTQEEVNILIQACKKVEGLLRKVSPELVPNPWRFLKTSGAEEGLAPYVRSDVIVLPENKIAQQNSLEFQRLLIHETAHVWSRLNPHKRDRIYARLGFGRISKVNLGPWLTHHRLNNPDGTHINYAIEIEHQGRHLKAMPLIYTPKDYYQPESGTLFDYVHFGLFEVHSQNGQCQIVNPNSPSPLSPREVSGFYEKISHNTQYILHPDEILASNLELLALESAAPELLQNLNSVGKALLEDIKAIIQEPAPPKSQDGDV